MGLVVHFFVGQCSVWHPDQHHIRIILTSEFGKADTGLDRKSAHPLELNTPKPSSCTAVNKYQVPMPSHGDD